MLHAFALRSRTAGLASIQHRSSLFTIGLASSAQSANGRNSSPPERGARLENIESSEVWRRVEEDEEGGGKEGGMEA